MDGHDVICQLNTQKIVAVSVYLEKPVRVNDLKAALQQLCPMVTSQTCQHTVYWNIQ
ncbi:hypothetical protein [Nitrospira sp. M1]